MTERRVTIKPTMPASKTWRHKRGRGAYLDTRHAHYGVFLDGEQVGDIYYLRGVWRLEWRGEFDHTEFPDGYDGDVYRFGFWRACDHARAQAPKRNRNEV